jgi:preprotein translocase SecE subunit
VYYYRYVVLVLIAFATFLGIAARAGLSAGFAQFGLADDLIGGVIGTTTLLSILSGVTIFAVSMRSVALLTFLDEVLAELGRVTWPTRPEAVRAATTVVVTASFLAVVISIYDLIWKNLANLILFNQS